MFRDRDLYCAPLAGFLSLKDHNHELHDIPELDVSQTSMGMDFI